MLNPPEAKRILEAALLAAQEPLSPSELKRLFDGELGVDAIRKLLAEVAQDWQGRAVELVSLSSGWRFQTRAELVRRLLEYERMKKAAQGLDELPQVGRDVIAISVWIEKAVSQRLPDVNSADLAEAWRSLLHRARLTAHHRVTREELSVRAHMSAILRALKERRVVEFGELFDPQRGVAVLVVTFLALLELARELLIEITQSESFAPIYVKLGYAQPV